MTSGNIRRDAGTAALLRRVRTDGEYRIELNFLPVSGELPAFTLYRRPQTSPQESRPDDGMMAYRMPSSAGDTDGWPQYWVSFQPTQGFEPFAIDPKLNPHLGCSALLWSLESAVRKVLAPEEFRIPKSRFLSEISFLQRTHHEGDELLVAQPYYLRATDTFGFLVDFHFHLREGVPFSKRVQQLSLSLDEAGRRNLNYYVDRLTKVNTFLRERQNVFSRLVLPGGTEPFRLSDDFASLPADRLRTKVYVFGNNREANSQFTGLRDHGPLKALDGPPRLLFVFREQDRQAARKLAISLRGSQQRSRSTFPGFGTLFKSDVEIDPNPVVLSDLDRPAIENALERARKDRQRNVNVLPILILPTDDDSYFVQKAIFANAEIPTQVCTLRILQDEDTLRWAIANLALQVFCKAGGQPWKVRPTHDRSLIIGVSQSHKIRRVDGRSDVEKYFAFSVMTDSSGLFQKIQVLGEDEHLTGYLGKLRESLAGVLAESAEQFDRVVVHTSFKLKYREIEAIQQSVRDAASKEGAHECKFAVVKVNQRSRFFGVNRNVNSLVPYEATRVRLGPREYLVWFEGIFPDRTTVTRAFPGPTHLQILQASGEQTLSDDLLLQDLVNLSGANWRGFNAKSTPVSVFYCHLVADLVHDFHERGLPLPAVKDLRPWFL